MKLIAKTTISICVCIPLVLQSVVSHSATTLYYVHTDHLNTPSVLTDQNGVVVWQSNADPFGNRIETIDRPNKISFEGGFPGQYLDTETGTYYNYFRDYDPSIGRYIQSDPIGLAGGLNAYAYVGGNPVNNIDPRGLDCVATNGSVTCIVPGGGPTITFPRPAGWPDNINSSNSNYHDYNIPVPLNGVDAACVMQAIANNPTPGAPNPATPSGTPNNATPTSAQNLINTIDYVSSFGNDSGGYNNSPVSSYLLNNGSVVVNVTSPGHPLFPGYVARTIGGGYVNNYGEGTGFLQGPYSPVAKAINGVWDDLTNELIKKCSCQ